MGKAFWKQIHTYKYEKSLVIIESILEYGWLYQSHWSKQEC